MKKGIPLLCLSALLLYATKAEAQNRIYVNEYLNIGVGGRGLAMAGAQSATTGDVMSGYWNPAGLMRVEDDLQVGLMHAEYFSGISKYDFGSIVKPLKNKKRVIGLSVMRFAIDDIPNTIDYVQPDGSFDESKLKSMTAGDYAFLLSYAQKLNIFKKNPFIQTNIGANAKIIYRNLGSLANAWGVGVDVGLQTTYKRWYFGLMAKDITTTYTAWSFNLSEHDKEVFGATGNEIPIKSYEVMLPRFNFGVARGLLKTGKKIQVTAELDWDLTTDGKRNTLISSSGFSIDPHMGLEAGYKNTIFLRAGIGNIQRVLDDKDTTNQKKYTMFQPSVGVGLKLKALVVDYAFTSLQTQSNPLYTHVISLRINVNAAKKKNIPDEVPPAEETK
ncbi:PorV/PorQ family protein [Chitinophagaceae bacterium MMS25-I14]